MMLKVKSLTKKFSSGNNTVNAVNNINFSIERGQFVSVIGKSGSGKSTLLSLLGALEQPTSGTIVIDNTDITEISDRKLIDYRRNKIGYVFQNYNLIPNLTALENVMLPMEFAHIGKINRKKRAASLLKQVGLDMAKQRRKPSRLSGGEQQRVAIARALANDPSMILADEPTGNLDTETGKMIFDLLHSLTRNNGTTIIVVTHDLSIAGKTDKTFKLRDGKFITK